MLCHLLLHHPVLQAAVFLNECDTGQLANKNQVKHLCSNLILYSKKKGGYLHTYKIYIYHVLDGVTSSKA